MSRTRIIVITGGIALAMPLGAAIGTVVLRGTSAPVLASVLAFGSVVLVLMYLVTEELLVKAHQVTRLAWAMPLFFVAFLMYLVIEELFGPTA